jgi:hypothetical protein
MKTSVQLAFVLISLCGCSSKVESAFKSGCTSSGVPSSVCSCVYKKIDSHLERVDKDINYMNSAEFQNAYVKAAKACANE